MQTLIINLINLNIIYLQIVFQPNKTTYTQIAGYIQSTN